ncbi:HD domain-containing protein [bacterium]|jgi:hypothetical protein|nr:HD domain-containing protein [bacterium]
MNFSFRRLSSTKSPRSWRSLIAQEAARLLAEGREHDFTDAKRRAARILGIRFAADDFPSTREIRDALDRWTRLGANASQTIDARQMSLNALRLMRSLRPFPTWLVGTVAEGSPIGILETEVWLQHADFRQALHAITRSFPGSIAIDAIDPASGGDRRGTILVPGEIIIKITVSALPPRPPALDVGNLSTMLDEQGSLEAELVGLTAVGDRFEIIEDLALSLENVRLDRKFHPEKEALFHALQLFDQVRLHAPFDEELLTAALLHDVGRARSDDEIAIETRVLLKDLVTQRTMKLVLAMELIGDGPAPSHHQKSALVGEENLDDLNLLLELDRLSRQPGIATLSLEEAIMTLRQLDAENF